MDDMLEGEMRQECSKFGVVQRIVIYEDHSAGGAVKIFALFSSPQGIFVFIVYIIIIVIVYFNYCFFFLIIFSRC